MRLLHSPARFLAIFAAALFAVSAARTETCTPQSQMKPAERDTLAAAASAAAARVQTSDAPGLRALSAPDLSGDFAAISDVVATTAPHLKGAILVPQQLYLLDATILKPAATGNTPEAQFFCTLNRSAAEAEFLIPGLPAGRYAFAMLDTKGIQAPWRLSFLFRMAGTSNEAKWLMAGFYPKPLTAAGHDGLWYWTQARQFVAQKQPWNAWLYLLEADALLQPAGFVGSSHLDKLRTEETSTAPPAVAEGVTPDAPLVLKAKDGTEYRFTSFALDDSLNTPDADVAVRLRADPLPDAAATRKRNVAAMSALLAAYPELRKPFHGVWIYASAAPNQPVYPTEQAMSDIP